MAGSPRRWLLCDYGNVLCLDQPEQDRRALAEAAGMEPGAFSEAYWSIRDRYDGASLTAEAFWAGVCGRLLAAGELARLVALDVRSWTHPHVATLAAVERARRRGFSTALLSNAPVEVAAAADGLAWLREFAPRLFSCDLGETKPAASIYAWALERLGAEPEEVVFVDDRPANVEAARRHGIVAVRFCEPAQIDQLAAGEGAPPPRPRHQS